MKSTPRYREQYNRMRRWYERFSAIDQGREHSVYSDNYLDEIYSFFQNCYHLKDWIIVDKAIPADVKGSVETYINSNRSLRLCADICNSLKHLHITSNRSGESPAFSRKRFAVGLGAGVSTTISLKYAVDTNSGSKDAFRLATDCVTAWDTFLQSRGLL